MQRKSKVYKNSFELEGRHLQIYVWEGASDKSVYFLALMIMKFEKERQMKLHTYFAPWNIERFTLILDSTRSKINVKLYFELI